MTAAALLARAGLDVVVLERRGRVGGAIATEELVPGYRFSTCAYALHLLHERVADELGLELDLLEARDAVVMLATGEVRRPDETGARALGESGFRDWSDAWTETARLVDATLLGPPPRWEELDADFRKLSMNELLARHFRSDEARTLFARPRGDALELAARAIPNLRDLVVAVVEHGPEDLERRVGLTAGQLHHLPHVPAAMFDRRGGARTGVEGLHRCGLAAHPGGEVSGVPGWNAAQAVLEDLTGRQDYNRRGS